MAIHFQCFQTPENNNKKQIWANDFHTNCQHILWRKSSNKQIKTYKLKAVTYKTAPALFIVVRTLQQLDTEEHINFSVGLSVTLCDFYVY